MTPMYSMKPQPTMGHTSSVADELAALLEAGALGKRFSVYLGIVHNCQHLLISTEGTN